MYKKLIFLIKIIVLFLFLQNAVAQSDLPNEIRYVNTIGPTLFFKTPIEVCLYLAARSNSTKPGWIYSDVIAVVSDPQWGKGCSATVTYAAYPDFPPQKIFMQNWWEPMGPFCPEGYSVVSSTSCHCSNATLCPKEPPPCDCDGNPIFRAYGLKKQIEVDYSSEGFGGLRFERMYNSRPSRGYAFQALGVTTLGLRWGHTYSSSIDIVTDGVVSVAYVQRPDGRIIVFRQQEKNWKPDSDIVEQLIQTATGWELITKNNGLREIYNLRGALTSIVDQTGSVKTLEYSDMFTPIEISPIPNMLIGVTDSFGGKLKFTYDVNGNIQTLTDPSGGIYRYDFSSYKTLTSVTYPDLRQRKYLYDEPEFSISTSSPALTGIIDENNVRYATFRYADGKAISTEHSGGVNIYSMVYSPKKTVVTDPLKTSRTYNFDTVLGVVKEISQVQPQGSGSAESTSFTTYDANGNVFTHTDFNGIQTRYTYELPRNLEKTRTEAYGIVGQQRMTTTVWHTSLRLPMQIFEPRRLITFTYDTPGNILSKTEQATLDIDGSKGTDAVVTGEKRKWSYTYYPNGQLWTVTGPRADVVDVTTYAYDTEGNLASVRNAVGQVTMMTDYDANGRVGTISDPNKIVTTMTYWPRGWLKSRTVTAGGKAEATTYDYDGVGQLKLVTLPDASTVTYSYDDAHRLTGVADSLGNSITYTLDNMGNRRKTEVKDPNGMLARQTTRVIDVLNRLQQSTGAQQ